MKMVFVFLLLILLSYPVWVVHKQTLGSHERVEKFPSEWGVVFENIEYKTSDGLKLYGWWVPAKSEKAVLLIHGNGGSRNGFHSGVFELGKWYREHGYNVMMVDLRAHGESEGQRTYFGAREHEDLLGWIRSIDPKSRFEWMIHGFSMGAVTALMMKQKDPSRFKWVVADAPWIDFHILAKQELYRRANLPPLFYGYVSFIAKRLFGMEFATVDNKERCRKLCGSDILYIFESEDTLVTPIHRVLLERACPDANIVTFEGVGHVDAFKECPDLYTGAVSRFLSMTGKKRFVTAIKCGK